MFVPVSLDPITVNPSSHPLQVQANFSIGWSAQRDTVVFYGQLGHLPIEREVWREYAPSGRTENPTEMFGGMRKISTRVEHIENGLGAGATDRSRCGTGPCAEIMPQRRDTEGGTYTYIFSGKLYSQMPAFAVG